MRRSHPYPETYIVDHEPGHSHVVRRLPIPRHDHLLDGAQRDSLTLQESPARRATTDSRQDIILPLGSKASDRITAGAQGLFNGSLSSCVTLSATSFVETRQVIPNPVTPTPNLDKTQAQAWFLRQPRQGELLRSRDRRASVSHKFGRVDRDHPVGECNVVPCVVLLTRRNNCFLFL